MTTDHDVDPEVLKAAEAIADGWYPDQARIYWDDLLDRLEDQTGIDLGTDMASPQIKAIKAHVRAYRRL